MKLFPRFLTVLTHQNIKNYNRRKNDIEGDLPIISNVKHTIGKCKVALVRYRPLSKRTLFRTEFGCYYDDSNDSFRSGKN